MGGDRPHHQRSAVGKIVSIHAPAWGATRNVVQHRLHHPLFRSTPLPGGRPARTTSGRPTCLFRSTPPHGGRPEFRRTIYSVFAVSIHAPAWGATRRRPPSRARCRSFDPRPRMGGDYCYSEHYRGQAVSIHAPAWGATSTLFCAGAGHAVSIHAPAWGATCGERCAEYGAARFDPRPRMGGDAGAEARHPPATPGFDPRPRMGGDPSVPAPG